MPSNFKALAGASGGEPNDPNFKNVTLLLHGDGSNGAQNNTFLDSSTNNFTITRNGNTTQGSFSPYGSNWSNYFDGSGDYISAPSNAALDCGTGDWTFECWVFVSTRTTNYPLIFGNNRGGFTTDALALTASNSDSGGIYQDRFVVAWGSSGWSSPSTGNSSLLVANATNSNNTWYHLALVRNGTSVKMYRNGVEVASATVSAGATFNWGYTNSLLGGGNWDGANGNFNGYISNARLLKGTALYTAAFTPSTTPLTAITNTSLLTCQSNRFRDASTNNFTITRNGDVKVTNFAPFAPSAAYSTSANGGSAYFDGTGDYLTTTYTTSNFDWYSSGVDFTIEYWFYANSLTGISYLESGTSHSTVIGNRDATSTTDYWSFGPTSAGTVTFYYYNGGSAAVISSATFNAGSWNHVAMTKTSSGITVFVNGVAGTTTAISGIPQSSTGVPLTIGQGNNSSYNGYVSNLRIVRGTAIYSGNFTPPTSPVTAVTNTKLLLNATNGAIFDNSMKSDLETVGNAQVSTSVKKFGTGSMVFDGSGDYLITSDTLTGDFGAGDFTVEFWWYGGAQPARYPCQVGTLDAFSATGAWRVTTYNDNANNFAFIDGVTTYSFAATNYNDSAWHHIAVTRSGTTVRGFVDGVQIGSSATVSTSFTARKTIAGGQFRDNSFIQGYIDDLRVTKGVARYTANFTPPTAAFPNK